MSNTSQCKVRTRIKKNKRPNKKATAFDGNDDHFQPHFYFVPPEKELRLENFLSQFSGKLI